MESGQIQPLGLSHAIGPPGWRPYFQRGIPSILKRLEHPKPHHRSLWWTFPLAPPLAQGPTGQIPGTQTPPGGGPGGNAPNFCAERFWWLACPSRPPWALLGPPGSPWAPLAPPGPPWPPLAPWPSGRPPLAPLAAPGPSPFRQIFSGGCNLVSRHGHAAPSHPWECRGAILQRKYCRCAARRPKP